MGQGFGPSTKEGEEFPGRPEGHSDPVGRSEAEFLAGVLEAPTDLTREPLLALLGRRLTGERGDGPAVFLADHPLRVREPGPLGRGHATNVADVQLLRKEALPLGTEVGQGGVRRPKRTNSSSGTRAFTVAR